MWNRPPEASVSSLSNYGNSLFGSSNTSLPSNHGDSLDTVITMEPVEEQNQVSHT